MAGLNGAPLRACLVYRAVAATYVSIECYGAKAPLERSVVGGIPRYSLRSSDYAWLTNCLRNSVQGALDVGAVWESEAGDSYIVGFGPHDALRPRGSAPIYPIKVLLQITREVMKYRIGHPVDVTAVGFERPGAWKAGGTMTVKTKFLRSVKGLAASRRWLNFRVCPLPVRRATELYKYGVMACDFGTGGGGAEDDGQGGGEGALLVLDSDAGSSTEEDEEDADADSSSDEDEGDADADSSSDEDEGDADDGEYFEFVADAGDSDPEFVPLSSIGFSGVVEVVLYNNHERHAGTATETRKFKRIGHAKGGDLKAGELDRDRKSLRVVAKKFERMEVAGGVRAETGVLYGGGSNNKFTFEDALASGVHAALAVGTTFLCAQGNAWHGVVANEESPVGE